MAARGGTRAQARLDQYVPSNVLVTASTSSYSGGALIVGPIGAHTGAVKDIYIPACVRDHEGQKVEAKGNILDPTLIDGITLDPSSQSATG